jgi:beta-ureidopropionase
LSIRMALAQFESADAVEQNVAKIEQMTRGAASEGVDLVVFHELATTPYFCYEHRNRDRFALAEPIPGPTTERVAALAASEGIHVILPIYERDGDRRYNTAVLIEPSGIKATYRKSHVPASGDRGSERGAEESFYFSAGDQGFPAWESDLGLKIGVLICYDRHFPEAARVYALQEVDLVVVPSASYRQFIVEPLWVAELQAMAFQNGFWVAGLNKIGPVVAAAEEARYPGQSLIIDPEGQTVVRAGDDEGLTVAEIDPQAARRAREVMRFARYRRPDLYGEVVSSPG